VVLDVRGLSPVTDFFVIATGTSERQMRTVTEDVQEFALPRGFRPLHKSTHGPGGWILIDFVDVIVHVFTPESRMFYDLDNLWGEAKSVDWEKESAL
jgi:ribosome-associated protein